LFVFFVVFLLPLLPLLLPLLLLLLLLFFFFVLGGLVAVEKFCLIKIFAYPRLHLLPLHNPYLLLRQWNDVGFHDFFVYRITFETTEPLWIVQVQPCVTFL